MINLTHHLTSPSKVNVITNKIRTKSTLLNNNNNKNNNKDQHTYYKHKLLKVLMRKFKFCVRVSSAISWGMAVLCIIVKN